MGRTENINVFQDTMNLCKNNDRIRESIHNSAEGQKLILEGDAITEPDKNRYKEKARITVSKKRTFEAASAYKDTKTAVHNFASLQIRICWRFMKNGFGGFWMSL